MWDPRTLGAHHQCCQVYPTPTAHGDRTECASKHPRLERKKRNICRFVSRRGYDGQPLSGATNDSCQPSGLPIFSLRLQPMPLVRCLYDARFQLCRARFCRDCKQDYDCSIEHAASRIMTAGGRRALKQMGEHAIRVLRTGRRAFHPNPSKMKRQHMADVILCGDQTKQISRSGRCKKQLVVPDGWAGGESGTMPRRKQEEAPILCGFTAAHKQEAPNTAPQWPHRSGRLPNV